MNAEGAQLKTSSERRLELYETNEYPSAGDSVGRTDPDPENLELTVEKSLQGVIRPFVPTFLRMHVAVPSQNVAEAWRRQRNFGWMLGRLARERVENP